MTVEEARATVAPGPSVRRDRAGQLIAFCPDGYLEVDSTGVVTEWNPRAAEMLGWRREDVVGRFVDETVLSAGAAGSPFARLLGGADGSRLADPAIGSGAPRLLELMHKEGHRIVAEGSLFDATPGSDGLVGCFIHEPDEHGDWQPCTRSHLHHVLTGLPNRALFSHQLAVALGDPQPVPGSIAVVLLDLDRFKSVNNSLGHDVGDQLLSSVAQRLRRVVMGTEVLAHIGGDEFLAMFREPGGASTRAAAFIERARGALAEPFEIMGTEVFLDASFGVALNTFGVDDPSTLMSNAEAAMYRAKRRGGSCSETFGESMRIEMLDRMATEHSLHRALERSELTLHYQPVVEIQGVKTVGVEALIRWQHPGRGVVPPYRFIPVAEESGLIIPIGEWVLEQACQQLHHWHHRDRCGPQGSMEVNLSARQIDDPRIVRTVEEILSRTGLPAEHLTLEITESALMKDAGSALQVLRALKETGVLLAIDDFGTGFSSLSYLQRFPLDILKVDRSFIEELGVGGEGEEIVGAVIRLAHVLGLEVVAEGVETTEQLEVLQSLECDLAQGFLFSRPVPAADIPDAFGLRVSA